LFRAQRQADGQTNRKKNEKKGQAEGIHTYRYDETHNHVMAGMGRANVFKFVKTFPFHCEDK
jgi:hypothetical protein